MAQVTLDLSKIGLEVELPPPSGQPHGSIYITQSETTIIANQDEWTVAAGLYQPVNLNGFSNVGGKLIYDGDTPRHVHGAASFSSETDAYKTIGYAVGLNGDVLEHSAMSRRHQSVDIGTGAVHWDTMMEGGDFIEFMVLNSTDASDIVVQKLYMFMLGMT